jgi:hypothetical protein
MWYALIEFQGADSQPHTRPWRIELSLMSRTEQLGQPWDLPSAMAFTICANLLQFAHASCRAPTPRQGKS